MVEVAHTSVYFCWIFQRKITYLFFYCYWSHGVNIPGMKDLDFPVAGLQQERACLLERQRTNFLFLFLPIWDNLRRNSIIFIPFSFPASAGRTIYNSIKSQISIPTRDFNPLSPNKSTAHLITESPHGEICDLKKTLIPTFYFMVERSRCEWEVSSHLPLTVFSVYKDFLKVYDITFNPSNKYTAKRSQDTLISCSGTKHLKNLHEIWTFKSKSSKIKIHLILNMSYHINK